MFFIAGFGPNIKEVGLAWGHCPACGEQGDLHLIRQSQALSLFFIPVLRFGTQYLATCPRCASVMELDAEKGRQVRRTPGTAIEDRDLLVLKNNRRPRCPHCGRSADQTHQFCPHCGTPL